MNRCTPVVEALLAYRLKEAVMLQPSKWHYYRFMALPYRLTVGMLGYDVLLGIVESRMKKNAQNLVLMIKSVNVLLCLDIVVCEIKKNYQSWRSSSGHVTN
jgi:hypothetical protein